VSSRPRGFAGIRDPHPAAPGRANQGLPPRTAECASAPYPDRGVAIFHDGAPGDRPTDLDPKHRSSRRTVGSPCDNQLVNQSSSLLPAPISASPQPQFSCGQLDSWCACVFGSVMRLACRLRSRAVDGCRRSSLQRSASSARIQSMRLRVVMHLSMVVLSSWHEMCMHSFIRATHDRWPPIKSLLPPIKRLLQAGRLRNSRRFSDSWHKYTAELTAPEDTN